jgi:methionyl aminopeptidase
MALIKSKQEIEILKQGGKRHAEILKELEKMVRPRVSAKELDDLAFRLIKKGGDKPAFLNYRQKKNEKPYPATLCVSVNEELVHTLPLVETIFKEGDIVSIDLGLVHKGLITDSAVTVPVGKIDEKSNLLLKATKECLNAGISEARAGNFIGDIGFAVAEVAKKYGFSVAQGLAGHGVGHEVHEEPLVPNVGKKGEGFKLTPGMVIAIEPMLCLGSGEIFLEKDGFTIRTADKKRSAHFEHTVAITEKGPVVLTRQ